MSKNPILEELRETREELLAEAGGTLAALVAKLQEDERKSGRRVLDEKELREKREAQDRLARTT
jgi:hypothetical protein